MSQSSPIAFAGVAGINVFWPFGGPLVVDQFDPDTDYSPCPEIYVPLAYGPWDAHVTPAVYAQCLEAGFDHFRVQINPGPWMQALGDGDTEYLAQLDAFLDTCVQLNVANGVGTVIDPYPTGYVRDSAVDILSDLGSAEFANFKATLLHWVERYSTAAYPPSLVCFELFNEPPAPGLYPTDWAGVIQPQLYAAVRAAAPNHTIILTGANYSDIAHVTALDPAQFDPNCLYTAHPFIPVAAALQGYVFNQYEYTVGVRYPPDAGFQASAITAMEAAVNASTTLTSAEKTSTIAGLTSDLNAYFETPQNGAWIIEQLALLTTWAAGAGLPPAAVILGEWGMTRPNTGFPGVPIPGYQGGSRLDRIFYYRDFMAAISRLGMRSSPDHLDTLDYGITVGQNGTIGAWDDLLILVASPRLVRPQYAVG